MQDQKTFITWLELPPRTLSKNARSPHRAAYIGAVATYRLHALERCVLMFNYSVQRERTQIAKRGGGVRFTITPTFHAKGVRLDLAQMRKLMPRWRSAEARATFHFPRKARRDLQNLAHMLEPAWDGFVDVGLLEDDDQLYVAPPSIVIDRDDPFGGVRIEITKRAL